MSQGVVAMMQQGKIVVRVRALIRAHRRFESRQHRLQSLLLIEPTGEQVNPHKGQTRRDADHLGARVPGDTC
jgi:hypothetical protein